MFRNRVTTLDPAAQPMERGAIPPSVIEREIVIRAMRSFLRSTEGGTAFAKDVVLGSWCVSEYKSNNLHDVPLSGESKWAWEEFFFPFYELPGIRKNDREEDMQLVNLPRRLERGSQDWTYLRNNPSWVTITTENRRGYAEYVGGMLAALRGLPVAASVGTSWAWRMDEVGGQRTQVYVPQYQLMFSFESASAKSFDPDKMISSLETSVCRAHDARADRSLNELFDEAKVFGCAMYKWRRDGVLLFVDTKDEIAPILKKVFSGCKSEIKRGSHMGKPCGWEVFVFLD